MVMLHNSTPEVIRSNYIPFKMETRVFAFVIGNVRPSQLNSVMEAACCDLVSDNTA